MAERVDTAELVEGLPARPGPTEGPVRVCVFAVAGELFAIDLRNVREVFGVESLTPVPKMPTALVGVTNLRGVIVPLVDLRPLLGLPSGGLQPYAVLVRHGTRQAGILVDAVLEIRTIHGEQVLPTPSGGSGGFKPFVSSILCLEDRMGGVVEVPTLLSFVETGDAT